jgi:hypothetical protein
LYLGFIKPIFFASCNKDDDKIEAPLGAYDNGVLIFKSRFWTWRCFLSYVSNDYFSKQYFSLVNRERLWEIQVRILVYIMI